MTINDHWKDEEEGPPRGDCAGWLKLVPLGLVLLLILAWLLYHL